MHETKLHRKCLRDVLETVRQNPNLTFEHQSKDYVLLNQYDDDMVFEMFEYAHKNGMFLGCESRIASFFIKGLSSKGMESLTKLKKATD